MNFLYAIILLALGSIRAQNKPFREIGKLLPVKIPSQRLTPNEFFMSHVHTNTPVFLRGALNETGTQYGHWTDDFLSSRNEDWMTYDTDKMNHPSGGVGVATFNEFINTYKDKPLFLLSALPKSLRSQVILPAVLQTPLFKRIFTKDMLLMHDGKARSWAHTADEDDMLCQLRGTQRIIIMNTLENKYMLPMLQTQEILIFNEMNLESVNLTTHYMFENETFYEAIVYPGDCLYIPANWIHQISMENSSLFLVIWFRAGSWNSDRSKYNTFHFQNSDLQHITDKNLHIRLSQLDYTDPYPIDVYMDSKLMELLRHHLENRFCNGVDLSRFIHNLLSIDGHWAEVYFNALTTAEDLFVLLDLNDDGILQMEEIRSIQEQQHTNANMDRLRTLIIEWKYCASRFQRIQTLVDLSQILQF